MEQLQIWWAESKIASWFRVFLAIVITQAISDFAQAGQFDFTNLNAWIIAALVATGPTLSRIFNPQDSLS